MSPPGFVICSHVEPEHFRDPACIFDGHFFQPDILPDELSEFFGRDFPEPFEPGDLGGFAQFLCGDIPFFFGITVERLFLVADPEERGFQNIEVWIGSIGAPAM